MESSRPDHQGGGPVSTGRTAYFDEATSEMKKKPDLLLVLMLVLGLGVLASSYTQGEPDPEMVASQFTIR
jgi:hypothetical protein